MSSNSKLLKKEYTLLVGGKWIKSQTHETFDVINPSNKEKLATCSRAKKVDVDNVIRNSRESFNKWKQIKLSFDSMKLKRR